MTETEFPGQEANWWVSALNFDDDLRTPDTPTQVEVCDLTLREAEQTAPITFRRDEILRIAAALHEIGIARLEMMPIVSPEHTAAFRELCAQTDRPEMAALTRFRRQDAETYLDAGADWLEVFTLSLNPWVAENLMRIDTATMIDRMIDTMQFGKEGGAKILAWPGDTFRTPLPVLEEFYKRSVEEGGADRVVVADSFGFTIPQAVFKLVRQVREWVPVPIEIHCHNDYGLATANTIAAVLAGATSIQLAVNGLGERGGNTSLDEGVMAMEALLGISTGIKLDGLWRVSRIVSDISGIELGGSKPIMGSNLHSLWTGLHVEWRDRAKKNGIPTAWTPFLPEVVGKEPSSFEIGPMSGRNAIKMRLLELGIDELGDEEMAELLARVKYEGSVRTAAIDDRELRLIVDEVRQRAPLAADPA
jgi:isopropylmalate/homocitrate/citramalate synthase